MISDKILSLVGWAMPTAAMVWWALPTLRIFQKSNIIPIEHK
ncbi:hypothetical protein [Anabaena catenula]|nr:hypothetical protein [Anabaena catenula]